MKIQRLSLAAALILALSATTAFTQEKTRAEGAQPLVLTGAVPLPNVLGRIDHLGFDGKGHLFVSALGNNTEEVIDLTAGAREQTISGIPRPQGVVYTADFRRSCGCL